MKSKNTGTEGHNVNYEYTSLGRLNRKHLVKEFGELQTDEIIITKKFCHDLLSHKRKEFEKIGKKNKVLYKRE